MNYATLAPPPYVQCARCGCFRPPAALVDWQNGKACADVSWCQAAAELLKGAPVTEAP